jgi:hypothetical protein
MIDTVIMGGIVALFIALIINFVDGFIMASGYSD